VPKHITLDAIENSSAKLIQTGDLLLALYGATAGESALSPIKGAINQAVLCIRSSLLNLIFLNNWLNANKGDILATYLQGGQGNLSAGIVKELKITFPTLPEQQKIAEFLTAVDEKIEKLKRKKELLEAYKKGAMQKLFSQEIRFKDDHGNPYPDWEEKRLGEVFRRVNTKNKIQNDNVMTISGQHGLINQVEYFNKSVSSKDTSHYTFLKRGQFAYNKSYSKGYPMGAIKRLSRYASGVVSPLYICFELSSKGNDEFFEHFFETGLLNKWIQRIAQEGARNHGLLNVSISEFFSDLPIPTPSLPEQQKIAEFLTGIDDKITAVANRIDKAAEFKQGLLQKMFV